MMSMLTSRDACWRWQRRRRRRREGGGGGGGGFRRHGGGFRHGRLHLCATTFLWAVFLLLPLCMETAEAVFGRQRRQREAEERERARLSKLVIIFGFEVNKILFYVLTGLIGLGLAAALIIQSSQGASKKSRGNRPDAPVDASVDVVVVCTGLPKKGMGWYHLIQLLEMTRVNVRAVVEPFFLNPELCESPPPSFSDMVSMLTEAGVQCVKSVDELDPFGPPGTLSVRAGGRRRPTLFLIAGRTDDNPQLFRQSIDKGATVIYLEKPGAPSVAALQEMRDLAEARHVKVYMGYNKNVTSYIQKTISLAQQVPNAHVFFCHNNSYATKDLPEVFSRNSEGMLKNMAIHELALLVTFFNVTVDSIGKFKVNTSKLFSEKLVVWKPGTTLPNPEYITDFSRVAFKITTKEGKNVSVMADRCGGNVSFAVVKDETGKEVQKFEFPDTQTAADIEDKVSKDPQMMPYFFVNSDDYQELKDRVVNSMIPPVPSNTGGSGGGAGGDKKKGQFVIGEAEGVATIFVGIEALKLAEYGTEQLDKALKPK